MVAVPWAVYSPSTDPNVLTVTVERDRIYNAPVFDYARIEEYSRPDYINNVYSYYGVSGGAAVGVGVSGGTSTTTTGANHDNGRDHNDWRGNRCEHNGRRSSKPGGRCIGGRISRSEHRRRAESTPRCGRGRGRSGGQGA